MSDQLKHEDTILILQIGSTEYAIDVNEEFKDVNVYFQKDGGKLQQLGEVQWFFSDDTGRVEGIAAALTRIAEITRREQANGQA